MKPAALVCLAVLALSCARPPAPEQPPAVAEKPAPVVEDDCTHQTPLVPGVPGSPGNLIPSEINPNGASELAALMRRMQKDLGAARDAIARGEDVAPLYPAHRKVRCSWPTAESDRAPPFDSMAQAYLAAVKAFDARPANPRAAHDAVITACVGCHQTACTGPIPAIESLRMPQAAATETP